MNEQERWIDKIQKLLAKAERAGTPEESDAFYAKAQELMTRWAVDEAMLSKEGKSSDTLTTEHVMMKRTGLFNTYVDLWSAIARANDVKLLVYAPSRFGAYAGVDLIGWTTDITKVKMLYTSLVIQMSRERNRVPDEYRTSDRSLAIWRKSFNLGYANRIGERLRESRRVTVQEVTKSSNSMALAVIDRSKAVQAFYDDIPKGVGRSRSVKYDPTAMHSGRQAADRADLGQTRVQGPRGELGR